MASAVPVTNSTNNTDIINLETWLASMQLRHYLRIFQSLSYENLMKYRSNDFLAIGMAMRDVCTILDGIAALHNREPRLLAMVQAIKGPCPNMEYVLRDIRHISFTPMKRISCGATKGKDVIGLIIDAMEHSLAYLYIHREDDQNHLISCLKCALDIFEIGDLNGMWCAFDQQITHLKHRYKRLLSETMGTFAQLTYRYSAHRTGHQFLEGEGRTYTEQEDYEKSMASLPKESRLHIYKGPQLPLPPYPDPRR